MNPLNLFYPIITGSDNPILRKKSVKVQDFNEEIEEFAEVLLALMYEKEGLWLSAPQLGKHLCIVAITLRKEGKKRKLKSWKISVQRTHIGEMILINPEILEVSPTFQVNEEGCLSLPEEFGDVKRHTRIKIKYFTPEWKELTSTMRWRNAVILQHELDHLQGILFTDKIEK